MTASGVDRPRGGAYPSRALAHRLVGLYVVACELLYGDEAGERDGQIVKVVLVRRTL